MGSVGLFLGKFPIATATAVGDKCHAGHNYWPIHRLYIEKQIQILSDWPRLVKMRSKMTGGLGGIKTSRGCYEMSKMAFGDFCSD